MAIRKTRLVEHDGCAVKIVHLDRVARARAEALSRDELEDLCRLFQAVADPTRLTILQALGGGEMCVCDLAALVGLSDSAVSHQLRRLKDAHLVRSRRDGQILYYALDDDHVADLIRLGLTHVRE